MTVRLSHPDEDRYQRLRLIQWWNQDQLKKASAFVIGAGALGNEVVKNLALLGIGKIWIADFDKIETTNLTRSALFRSTDVGQWKAQVLASRAAEMNGDCEVYPLTIDVRYDVGLAFLKNIDLVFGCLDNREARYHINRSCYLLKKQFIDAGLDTLNGSVSIFHPPTTACYECTLTPADRIDLQKRFSCLKSKLPEMKQHVPTAPTIASIMAGLQVQIGIRSLHGLNIPSGKRLGLYGLSDVFFDIQLAISDECGLHSTIDPLPDSIQKLQTSPSNMLKDALIRAHERWNASALSWDFDRDITVGLNCTSCGKTVQYFGSHGKYSGNSECNCGGIFKPQIATSYDGNEEWGNKTFIELGFPEQHIYSAVTPDGNIYFELSE
jgi:molybdopterin-synthase adenylyltransferase